MAREYSSDHLIFERRPNSPPSGIFCPSCVCTACTLTFTHHSFLPPSRYQASFCTFSISPLHTAGEKIFRHVTLILAKLHFLGPRGHLCPSVCLSALKIWINCTADALILLMLLIRWCCWCTDAADATESGSGSAHGPFYSFYILHLPWTCLI